jgi:hypothetical protein
MGAQPRGISTGTRAGGHNRRRRWRVAVGGVGMQSFIGDLVQSCGSGARARRLNVTECMGWYVWVVAAEHLSGEVGVVG